MTEQRLTTLLHELADDVKAPDLAARAWEIAGRRRKRRAVTLAAGAGLVAASLVVGVLLVQSPNGSDQRRVTGASSSPPSAPAAPQLAPARSAEVTLPFLATILPQVIDTSASAVAATPTLSADPITRASALVEPWSEGATPGPVLVVGSDGGVRRLDVALAWVADSGGNKQLPLDSGSLAPDGVQAAFAQRNAVVIVDLTSGTSRRVTVLGFNERVTWSPDSQRVLVAGASGESLVTLATSSVAGVPGMAPGPLGVLPAVTQVFLDHWRWADLWQDGSVAMQSEGASSPGSSSGVRGVAEWWGQAFASGGLVAAGGFSSGLHVEGASSSDPQVIAVFNPSQPAAARLLAFDWEGRNKGCCSVVGWLGTSTVLFTSEGGSDPTRVLAWDWRTGQVLRVSQLTAPSVVSLALG